jgi:hypothetical protein
MFRLALLALSIGLIVVPAFGQPREWKDDFTTVTTYDSGSVYATCASPTAPSTKYTLIEAFTGNPFNGRALSGGGKFIFTNRSTAGVGGLRADLAAIGVVDFGQTCPDNPDPSPGASLITSEPFTSNNQCTYGGLQFTDWQLKFPPDTYEVRGSDGKCGVANVDDDLDGITDEDNECLACRPTFVNGGYGNRNGTGFQGGVDAAPGVAGVDDDANGIVDDLDEMGWSGSDDGDDTTRQAFWIVLKANLDTSSLIFVEVDPATVTGVFNMGQIISASYSQLEGNNEIVKGYYRAHVRYNWVFCVSGTCYGAVLWEGTDMANPDETLGPLANAQHTAADDNLAGFVFFQSTVPLQFTRQQHATGNSNFSDAYWVVSGNPANYYPSPSADLDGDKDVDGFDFLTFSNCYNGSNKPALAACANRQADLDKDGDVDGFDFLTFSNCYNGSNRKPLAACFPPNLTNCGS